MLTLIDSHCHLSQLAERGYDISDVVQRANEHSVRGILCIATSVADAKLIPQYQMPGQVWITAGIHPLSDDSPEAFNDIRQLIQSGQYQAIGETGLDYYYAKSNAERERQRRLFEYHVALAEETKLPLIVHCRDAVQDIQEILATAKLRENQVVIHCFTGDRKTAESFLDLGCVLSFSGIVTFKNATDIREAVEITPFSHLLVETDSPYLAPVPHRGKTNEPAYVIEVAKQIASIKNVPLSRVASETTKTFEQIFLQGKSVG